MKLQIPEPCHEKWNEMTPTDRGRYCSSCEKKVIDFSNKSDAEILRLLQGKNTCGRFQTKQLNRPLISDPSPAKKWFQAGTLAAFLGVSFPSISQKSSYSHRENHQCVQGETGRQASTTITPPAPYTLNETLPEKGDLVVHLFNQDEESMAFGKLIILNSAGQAIAGAYTNENGDAYFTFKDCPTDSITLSFRDYNYTPIEQQFSIPVVQFPMDITVRIEQNESIGHMTVGMIIEQPKHPILNKIARPFRRAMYYLRYR